MQWAAPEYSSEQDKIQSLSQRMEKLRLHYRKVEKQDIPASQMIFSGWQHGSSLPFVRCSALPSVCASPAYLPSSTWHYW
ncbi:hypothetical protein, partial [Escherichia coli]|uniref:hypothetical protein n=1 Tax=Escherichia coli TaxID=562 RepID=UPI003F5136FD